VACAWRTWWILMHIASGRNDAALRLSSRIRNPRVFPILQYALKLRVLVLCGMLVEARSIADRVIQLGLRTENGDERAAYFYVKYTISAVDGDTRTQEYKQECFRSGPTNAALSCFGFR
jgi:hypothetical protein